MTIAFVLFLVVHGLIHLMGFAKAFGYADLPDLTVRIPPLVGLGWLAATLLFLSAAALVLLRPRSWWLVGLVAVVVSTVVIVPSWRDAKVGMAANALALVGIAFGVLAFGPASLRAAYDREVDASLRDASPGPVVRDADLAPLPPAVQRYLRASGVVGQPRPTSWHVRMHGRIRSAPDAPWMPFTAEQHNVVGAQVSRLFYMSATRAGVPLQGYHRFLGDDASMTIKAAALVPVVRMRGEVMTQSETVTLFNDMCVMAPATLLDPRIRWQATTARVGRDDVEVASATFTHLGRTIAARLFIDQGGRLVDFVSDDRHATSPDGTTTRRLRWSTPLRDPRSFGPVRLMSTGEGRWHEDGRSWAYIELTLDEVGYW